MSWVSSAFNGDDGLDLEDNSSKRSSSRGGMRTKQKKTSEGGVLWSEQHQPASTSELAVHRKKVQEVENWLNWALDAARQSSRETCILLLTGPAGCGKTATVRMLAQGLGITINEWLNPVTEAYHSHQDDWETGWSDIPYQESQSKMFGSFLRKAGRYQGIIASDGHSQGQQQIILVEDLPNAFYREPAKFHEIIRSQATCCLHPIVFIVSDTSRSESSATRLFPQYLTSELHITHVSFNPVAFTAMVKALNRVISQQTKLNPRRGEHFFTPSKEFVDALAESAGGDVRSAVNSLQFACSKGTGGGKGKSSMSGKRTLAKRSWSASSMSEFLTSSCDSREQLVAGTLPAVLGSRDHSLFLFRSLGKVFYCKRTTASVAQNTHNTPTSAVSSLKLPAHLHMHERNPLEANPEEVLEHTQMSGDMFTLYLHQNYVDFFTDMDDIARGARYLSDSTLLHQLDWSQVRMSASADVGTIVACRGLMHANDPRHSTGKHSWRPLHKPEWMQVNKKYNSYCHAMKGLFLDLSVKGCSVSSVVMQTELLPYLAIINVPLRNSAQVNLLQQVTHFTRRHVPRLISEKLGEKDIQVADEGSDLPDFDATSFSLSQPSTEVKHNAAAQKDAKNEETRVLVDDIRDFSDTEDW